MNRSNIILLLLFLISSAVMAQELFIDSIYYDFNGRRDCGLVYQVKYDSGETDTMFVNGLDYWTNIKHKFFGNDTLVVLRGDLRVAGAGLECFWYVRDENNLQSKYGWKWKFWNFEPLYSFMPRGVPIDYYGNYDSGIKGRVPVNLDNLVIAGYGDIYEIVDGEKLWYGNKYFEEINNGARPVYQMEAHSLLAKHIGKENLDPKVAKWYFKE